MPLTQHSFGDGGICEFLLQKSGRKKVNMLLSLGFPLSSLLGCLDAVDCTCLRNCFRHPRLPEPTKNCCYVQFVASALLLCETRSFNLTWSCRLCVWCGASPSRIVVTCSMGLRVGATYWVHPGPCTWGWSNVGQVRPKGSNGDQIVGLCQPDLWHSYFTL